jgi:hypothetical protein
MANILAAQNGNWSSSSTWTGGVIPGAGDNVYSNNKTVTIDISIVVVKISNKSENGATAAGKFTLNNGVIVTADVEAGNVTCVDTNLGVSATINGNITAGTINIARGLDNTSTGTITINGNITGGSSTSPTGTSVGEGVRNSSSGSIVVTGIVNGGTVNGNYGILNLSSGSIIINGDLYGNNSNNFRRPLVNYGGGTITVNGNCYGSVSSAVYSETTSIGGIITINGNCFGASNAGTGTAINNSSPSDVYYIYGNCSGGTGSTNSQYAVLNNSSGIINIIGNCTGGYNPLTLVVTSKVAVWNNSSGIINITGSIYGGPKSNTGIWAVAGSSSGVYNNSSGIVNITGDCYGGSSNAVTNGGAGIINITGNSYVTTTPLDFGNVNNSATTILNSGVGTINITGNVYGCDIITHTASITVNNNSSGTVAITGICYAGLTCSAVRNSSTGTLDAKRAVGNVFGTPSTNGQVMASYGVHSNAATSITYVEEIQFGPKGNTPINGIIYPKLNTGLKVIFRKQDNATDTVLVNPLSSTDYPLETNVKLGVSYAFGNLSGSCAVPNSNNVSFNVPVGSGIGTAVLTANDFFNFNISGANANSIWSRLNNCATVETTIAQIAAAFSDD